MFSCFLCWDVNYCLFLYEHISDFQDKVQPPVVATGLQERSNLYISPSFSFLSSVADKMNSCFSFFFNRSTLIETSWQRAGNMKPRTGGRKRKWHINPRRGDGWNHTERWGDIRGLQVKPTQEGVSVGYTSTFFVAIPLSNFLPLLSTQQHRLNTHSVLHM